MIKKIITTTFFLFSILSIAQTQSYSNEFLAIGVGARAHGMSGAVIASTGDVYSSYWNPAGLSSIESPLQLGLMHAEWFAGVAKYDFLGFAKPLGGDKKRTIGLSVIRFGIDNIPYTLNLIGADGSINYDNVRSFSASDYAIQGSYAQILTENLSIGGNIKVIRRVIGTLAGAWGVGADLGIQYKVGKFKLAAVGRDITTTYNAWTATLTADEKLAFATSGNAIPKTSVEITKPTFFIGAAYSTPLSTNLNLTVEANAGVATDGQRNVLVSAAAFNLDPRVGFELEYQKNIWLRGGIGNFQRLKNELDPTKKELNVQPNFGVGLRLGRLIVDYGLTNIGNTSAVQVSHIFSLKLDLTKRKVEKEIKTI
ncbi:MAG: PorV/PorQ family protein [Saprospiraceae bacterium]|nr:PorV/PorQ family protein [Saprospiraceae bacterium]